MYCELHHQAAPIQVWELEQQVEVTQQEEQPQVEVTQQPQVEVTQQPQVEEQQGQPLHRVEHRAV
jgi:hypothetical protein